MARTFDGVDDQVAFGSEAAIDQLAAFTSFNLIRITASVTDERQVMCKMSSSFNGKMYMSFQGTGGSPTVLAVVLTRNAGSAVSMSVANSVATNTWTAVAATWDGTNAPKIFTCAIGGVMTEVSYGSQTAGSGAHDSDAGATLRLGTRDTLDATFFSGGMANSSLWNRVLTADELRALGRGYAPDFFTNGLVFNCRVDGRTSPEQNLVSGGVAGTVTGTTFLDHPPIIYPGKYAQLGKGSAAAAFNVAWAARANVLLGTGRR